MILLGWLEPLEHVFDICNILNNLKVKVVAIELGGHASNWSDHMKKQHHMENKGKIATWDKMLNAFLS